MTYPGPMIEPFGTSFPIDGDGSPVTVLHAGTSATPVPVVALHGITGSAMSWATVVRGLGPDIAFFALDLRGRGASSGHPGPFGMAAHASDVVALLDLLGAERAVVVGHSMGAHVAAAVARRAPERCASLVLVDGGLPLDLPAGADPDAVIDAVVGPAIARLEMTWPTRDAALEFWRQHPAFAASGSMTSDVDAYVDYDVAGSTPPHLRSRVSEAAVRADGRELLTDSTVGRALERVRCPVRLLRAPRGMLDEPDRPLLSDEQAHELVDSHPRWTLRTVDDTNHYTIVLAPRGAAVVASTIRTAVADATS